MPKNFSWAVGQPLPNIEPHSVRKIEVLEKYLNDYFDTVVPNPATDCLNITLVDGFCGGGAYTLDSSTQHGSPLVLLNAVRNAEQRLNIDRAKPLKINARFFFVDDDPNHIAVLQQQMIDEGFGDLIGNQASLIVGKFHLQLPEILRQIQATQRAGRSIFVLDQFGYSDVPMGSIKSIFSSLDRPEVILTFAIDSLLNYLQEASADNALYKQFGVDRRFIETWQANKEDKSLGRLITQRMLMSHIQQNSGAKFFTPFMLWSRTDNRWMMIAHLSRHQAARDKMLGVHWDSQNSFRHIGRGSLFDLGYDSRILDSKDSLFNFSDIDRTRLGGELLEELPREIFEMINDEPIAISNFLENIGNRTAATNNDLFRVLEELSGAKEIEVLSSSGNIKRAGTKIKVSDRLLLPAQKNLF